MLPDGFFKISSNTDIFKHFGCPRSGHVTMTRRISTMHLDNHLSYIFQLYFYLFGNSRLMTLLNHSHLLKQFRDL